MKNKKKRKIALLTGLIMTLTSVPYTAYNTGETANAATSVIAFPGAVGGGKYATGGRGGTVVHVTNLNDSGTGSFRDAVSQSNRIVVFDVSGTIELESNILVSSNVTIAGQTAPGGSGVTLKNYKLGMSGDNIICRYISSRPGPYASTSSGNDAWGGAKGSNSIIDHCSMGWTTDEQWGLYSNNTDYTVQYSVIGPADSWGGHKKGLHGFGLMMGKGNLTFDHNLIIHNVSRNFRGKVQGTYTADFTNNIIYDWGYQTAYGTIGHLNYVNNTLKAGNSTTGGYHWMYVDSSTSPENFKVYCSGNQLINKDGTLNSITDDNWSGVTVKTSIGITADDLYSETPFSIDNNGEDVSSVADAESTADSYEHVLTYAGNGISSDKRTAIDQQCAEETKNGTGSCSGTSEYDSSVTDLDKYSIECGVTYEYPSAVLTKEIVDTDNDGMPDEWEIARGLDPNDASDTNGDYCGQGYTNIEYYINDLTVDSFPEGTVTLSPEVDVETISAFETIEAENYSEQSGVKSEDCTEGGQNVGYIENGDYIMFKNVDFEDGAKSFTARIAGGSAGIELYLDNMNGDPAAALSCEGSGSWQTWADVTYNIPTISGVHNLYLKFTGGDGFLLNINNFVFSKESVPLNGELITNLNIYDSDNSSDWYILTDVEDGSLVYGDREVTYSGLPDSLKGSEVIQTACDSKSYSGTVIADFTAGDDITVYVALDSRVTTVPDWLSGYEKTSLTFTNSSSVTYDCYKKELSSGEKLELGANGQSSGCVNYVVLAQLQSQELAGDINSDGSVNSADAVLLQSHLLGRLLLDAEQEKRADLNGDGITDVFDMTFIRKALINS